MNKGEILSLLQTYLGNPEVWLGIKRSLCYRCSLVAPFWIPPKLAIQISWQFKFQLSNLLRISPPRTKTPFSLWSKRNIQKLEQPIALKLLDSYKVERKNHLLKRHDVIIIAVTLPFLQDRADSKFNILWLHYYLSKLNFEIITSFAHKIRN